MSKPVIAAKNPPKKQIGFYDEEQDQSSQNSFIKPPVAPSQPPAPIQEPTAFDMFSGGSSSVVVVKKKAGGKDKKKKKVGKYGNSSDEDNESSDDDDGSDDGAKSKPL